ncbi:MAG: flagellar biosynthesis anti-sigma factor FlgM [Rhodoferax sp.]|uniref:flagellar biosynthesis anti-sigma factor FlgM n=1 Tax=Rhodoferax sp. TaxID=50421 RepID=UPI0026055875|nr:flagellar biosynthesis anti-sigma factor FlgM [Rhodoferax sp.]MDD2880943.1 flagellar biosynthesis anti-sigma factor FlgM [Rhodoferax sp.]
MKISQPSDKPVAVSSNAANLAAKNGPVAGTPAKTTAAKSTQAAGVAVTVSPMARSLEAGSTSETADIDTVKVNAVRASIAQGTYKVNAEAIADKLLANAQEMLTRSRG